MHNYNKLVDTPIEKGLYLSMDQCIKLRERKQQMAKVSYVNVVSSLMYARCVHGLTYAL